MSAERLRLVTDFAELRAGMIVVVKACDICGAPSHRAMVIARGRGDIFDFDNEAIRDVDFVDMTPNPPCYSREESFVVDREMVCDGFVFRVEDGLNDASTEDTTATRPREMERTR